MSRTRVHLRAKHPEFARVLQLRSKLNFATHKFFMVSLEDIYQ
jgi:aspartyl/asparaginyl-tRNA synthetase